MLIACSASTVNSLRLVVIIVPAPFSFNFRVVIQVVKCLSQPGQISNFNVTLRILDTRRDMEDKTLNELHEYLLEKLSHNELDLNFLVSRVDSVREELDHIKHLADKIISEAAEDNLAKEKLITYHSLLEMLLLLTKKACRNFNDFEDSTSEVHALFACKRSSHN